jgi:putative PIN family toxin of toxin-antitoxin system
LGDRIFDLSFILWEIAELVIHLPDVKVCSDPDDDNFLATAVGGKADHLVTGDVGDLLHLREYQGVAIVSPRDFISRLKIRSGA